MNLEEFRAWAAPRCKETPYLDGELPCLVWQGATTNKGRDPRAVMHRGQQPVIVRREAWAILHPNAPLRGQDAAKPTCDCPLCVEPTHLRRFTSSEYRRGVPKSMATRLKMQVSGRAARSRVTNPEVVVPLVKADDRPAWQVAADLGLGADVIRDMRAGKWDRQVFGASPFAGLGARP